MILIFPLPPYKDWINQSFSATLQLGWHFDYFFKCYVPGVTANYEAISQEVLFIPTAVSICDKLKMVAVGWKTMWQTEGILAWS